MRHVSAVIRQIVLLALLLASWHAWAADTGRVVQLVGTVSLQRPDGAVKVLSLDSTVMTGDIVSTQKNSTVRISFGDGGQLSLRPETQIKIESYNYEEQAPEKDSMSYSILKGGLRAITGLIGKRGNRDAYKAKATEATIGIRGTKFGMLSCKRETGQILSDEVLKLCSCTGLADAKRTLPDGGLYVDVTEGSIGVTNNSGTTVLDAGESVCIADENTPPQKLPGVPGLGGALPDDIASLSQSLNLFGLDNTAVCRIR